MSERGNKDVQYSLFFFAGTAICVLAVLDPFGIASPSRRSLAGLVIGPLAIGYAIYGIAKGAFPELSRSRRNESRFQFWFCFSVFVLIGLAGTFIGIKALTTI